MNRKPEFHLYLYSLEDYKKDVINANTIEECSIRCLAGFDIDTYQVMACTTTYLKNGYRIFVHPDKYEIFEITLGTCECFGGRELKMGHNLPRLIVTYLV